MTRFRLLATSVLPFAVLASACSPIDSGSAVVNATVRDHDRPVPDAVVSLRLLSDSTVTAVTDSVGRVHLELEGARGPGLLEVARDTTQPRPNRVYAPLLLEPDGSARLVVTLDAEPGHQARYMTATRMARWGRAAQAVDAIERDHYAAYNAWVVGGKNGPMELDLGPTVDWVRGALAAEEDPEVRSALWVALITASVRGEEMTAQEADRALREIPPGAAIWAWRPWSVPSLVRIAAAHAEGVAMGPRVGEGQEAAGRRALADRRTAAYLDRVIEAWPDTVVQPQVLLGAMMLADEAGRQDDAVAYYDRLIEMHPGSQAAQVARQTPPGARLQVGDPVPDVPLPPLDSMAPPITPDQLAGPATLVDFWAAWCTPCVAEMPVIHAAYERFHDRGFDVVSISYDATREDVVRFRRRYPMPWHHAFAGAVNLADGEVASAWGVNGLPAAFLVGADGTIIALEGELRGDRLMQTLERVLGE